MRDSLTSGHPIVNPDVVPIWSKLFVDVSFYFIQQSKKRVTLVLFKIKIGAHMPARDYEVMTIRYGKSIPDDDAILVGKHDAI